MALEQAIASCMKASARGKFVGGKMPFRMASKFFVTFILRCDGIKESARIGGVHNHRQAQSATGVPDWTKAKIINRYQVAIRITIIQTELLKNFDTADSATLCIVGRVGWKCAPLSVPYSTL